MTRFVLDCSVTMAWCFEDESAPGAEKALDALGSGEAVVPSLWPLEVANALLAAERRKQLTEAQSRRFIEMVRELPIVVDEGGAQRGMNEILALARERGLSAYDAAYLEVAMREGLPIATLDRELAKTAKRSGIAIL